MAAPGAVSHSQPRDERLVQPHETLSAILVFSKRSGCHPKWARAHFLLEGALKKWAKRAGERRPAAVRSVRATDRGAVEEMVRPVVEAAGLELWDVELRGQEGRPVLRVTVDARGVDLDAVAEVSERLSRRLDLEDFSDRPYQLEVSSPGVERALREPRHFEQSIGRTLKVRTAVPVDGQRVHEGALVSADAEAIVIASDGGELRVPYADVASAKTSSSGAQRRGTDDESGHDRGAEGARAREGHRVRDDPCRSRGGHGVGIQVVVEQHPELEEESFGVRSSIDPESGDLRVWLQQLEVTEHEDEETGEITTDSRVLSEEEVGVTDEFKGRIGAQTAKQVIFQKLRDAEREMTYEEFAGREATSSPASCSSPSAGTRCSTWARWRLCCRRPNRYRRSRIGTASVSGVHHRGPPRHQGSADRRFAHASGAAEEAVRARGTRDRGGDRRDQAVAREPGHRSKIAVASREPAVDPVGASVGPKGSRVRNVVTELRGEKIDVVPWAADPATLVANALQPAKVKEARVDDQTQTALVIVPDYQLSLAIGKEGQNARLAARLTGWRIDIKSETQFADEQRGSRRPRRRASTAVPQRQTQAPTADAPVSRQPAAEEVQSRGS